MIDIDERVNRLMVQLEEADTPEEISLVQRKLDVLRGTQPSD